MKETEALIEFKISLKDHIVGRINLNVDTAGRINKPEGPHRQ